MTATAVLKRREAWPEAWPVWTGIDFGIAKTEPRIIIEGRRAAKKAERDDKRKAKRDHFISAMIRRGKQ
jgi:hypothetical protein